MSPYSSPTLVLMVHVLFPHSTARPSGFFLFFILSHLVTLLSLLLVCLVPFVGNSQKDPFEHFSAFIMGNQGVADTVLGQGNQAEQSQPRHSSLRNVPIPSFIDKSRVILRTKANKLKAHSFVFQVVGKSSQFPVFLKPKEGLRRGDSGKMETSF